MDNYKRPRRHTDNWDMPLSVAHGDIDEVIERNSPATAQDTHDAFSHQWAPSWLASASAKLTELSALREGWDSYGAPSISQPNILLALNILTGLCSPKTPEPTIIPTVQGGVQLEWHQNGIDLEIEIKSPTNISVLFEKPSDGREEEIPLKYDLSPIGPLLDQLSE